MPTVPIGTTRGAQDVELDDLTPRAAAIARIWSANHLHTPCPLIVESVRTLREMGADPDEAHLWWGADAMDRPHRFVLDVPATLPGGHGQPLPARLEAMAQRLPIGYIPVGGGTQTAPPANVDELREDADLLTRAQVSELLCEQGRPVSVQVIANYKANPPKGWPQPAKYVGRTPLWSRTAIEAYADQANGTS